MVTANETTETIEDFIDKGNYHAAFNIALSALNECRRSNDQAGVDRYIHTIQNLVSRLTQAFGSPGA